MRCILTSRTTDVKVHAEKGYPAMVRILHLADIHLGAAFTALGEHATERRRDLQNALSRAVDYALDARHHIHAVVIAGDLFDTATPPNALVDDALQEIGRLAQAGLPPSSPGNHDALNALGVQPARGGLCVSLMYYASDTRLITV